MHVKKCTYCSSTNLGLGYQMGNAQVYPDLYAFHSTRSGSVIEHILCKDCGAVLYSYVRNPALFHPYSDVRQNELLDYINDNGILLCNENNELPSLCSLGYEMEHIVTLIEQKKVFYCKAYKKRATFLSVKAYQHLCRCRAPKQLPEAAQIILAAMRHTPAVDKDELRFSLSIYKKNFDRAFDYLLTNLHITAAGGKRLNPSWYVYLYCTAEKWKEGVPGLHFSGNNQQALWDIVCKNMKETDFAALIK